MEKLICGIVLAVWTSTLLPAAHAASIEVAIGGWRQDPNGMLNVTARESSNEFDLDDDLDYDPEYHIFGRLKLETPLFFPNIYVIAAPMEFEGSGSANVDFDFDGQSFSAGDDLDSKLTLNQYDLALYYSVPALRAATAGTLNIDVGLNLRWLDFAAEITGISADQPGVVFTEEEDLSIVVPMLYAALQVVPHKRLAIEAEVRGLSIGDNSLYSLLGRIRFTLVGPAFITAGYRYDAVDIDEGDIRLDADFSGPFAELGFKF